jgi:hypothetical protein
MRKKLLTFALTLMITLVMAFPAQAAFQDMWAQVYKLTETTIGEPTLTPVTTGATYVVLSAGSNTKETLYVYGDNTYTSLTNPITTTSYASTTGGMVQFRVDPTHAGDKYVDLIVVDTAGGYTAVVKNFDRYTHKVVIDERLNVPHHGVIWFSGTTTDATSTGVIFDKYTNISKVGLEVVTVLSGQTINIGTETTADAFIHHELLTTAGFITTSGASTGSLLGTGTAYQWYNQGTTITTAASYLYYTVGSTTGTPAGYIHYWFTRVR